MKNASRKVPEGLMCAKARGVWAPRRAVGLGGEGTLQHGNVHIRVRVRLGYI